MRRAYEHRLRHEVSTMVYPARVRALVDARLAALIAYPPRPYGQHRARESARERPARAMAGIEGGEAVVKGVGGIGDPAYDGD